MAYGFNLGQIDGLNPSIKTVTLTIANATVSNTYTVIWDDNAGSWTDDIDNGSMWLYYIDDDVFGLEIANFTESDVGDTYNVTISTSAVEENFKSAVETILVDNGLIGEPETLFDGTITITAEDTQGVEIPFDKDVSAYPFDKWTVTVNGLEMLYQAGGNVFILEDGNIGYAVFDNDGVYMINVVNIQDASHLPVPGDYQVKIVAQARGGGGGSSGLPDVSASDNGSVMGVVNGEWGVDDRLKDYPPISNNNGAVLGFGLDRDGNRVAQSIVPAPMSYSTYSNNAFYLPFKDNNANQPRYIAVKLDARPVSQNFVTTPVLVDKYGSGTIESFVFSAALLPMTDTKTYTLKATVDNGSITFSWVADTDT